MNGLVRRRGTSVDNGARAAILVPTVRANGADLGKKDAAGFTRTETVCVIAGVILLSAIFLGAQAPENAERHARITCVNQLKMIGLAFRMYSNDHHDRFPMLIEEKEGGSKEAVEKEQVYKHFQGIAEELQKAQLASCPADERKPAENFKDLRNENISYFVAPDADETKPTLLLSGDRNITNGLPVKASILELPANRSAGWTGALHKQSGQIGLSDGSVQVTKIPQLNALLQQSGDARNRIQLPEAGSGSEEE